MLPIHHAILGGGGNGPYDPSIYRQVADRCDIPTSSGAAIASPGLTVRTKHTYYGRKPTTTLKVGFANFFLNGGVTGETLGAADTTLQCAIEVNGSPGTYTDFTFGGLTTVTPGAANHVISDATAIGFTLKPGDTFFIRTLDISPTSSIFAENVGASAAGVTDGEWRLSGNFLHGGEGTGVRAGGFGRWPSAILAPSGYAAWLVIGDSRCWGQNETKEGDGTSRHRGWPTKWVADRLGYGLIRMGKSGDKAQNIAGTNGRPKCFALATACGITHGLVQPGINDLLNSQTSAQTITSLKGIATKLRAAALVKLVAATMEPCVSQISAGADWSVANQQDDTLGTWAGRANWALTNDTIRAFTNANSGFDMVLEAADLIDTGRNAGFWNDAIPGVGGASTTDGIHAAVTTNGNVSPWTYVANNLPRTMP